MAAHARCFHLGSPAKNTKFVNCVERLALSNNVSTVLLATDAKNFQGVGDRKSARATVGESQPLAAKGPSMDSRAATVVLTNVDI